MSDTTTPTGEHLRKVARMADDNGYHVFTVPGPWHDIDDVAAANRRAGGHWFDTDSKRFFRSRWDGPMIAGRLFVSSEKGPDEVRRYTIRVALDDASITDLDGFQAYGTRAAALAAARAAVLAPTIVPTGPYSFEEVRDLRGQLDRLANVLRDMVEPEADIDRPAADALDTLRAAYVTLSSLMDAATTGRGPLGGRVGRHLFDPARITTPEA